jgi:raffinose/stachyose/melibiose transport system permease protein
MIPGLFFYTFFSIFPILMGIRYSFTDWNGFSPHFNNVFFANYMKIFHDDTFLNAMSFTFRYAFALLVTGTALSLFVAIALDNKGKSITFFRALYFFPAVLSMLTLGLIFNQIYYRALPILADATGLVFLKGVLSTPSKAFWGVLFVHIWQSIPIPTILFLAGLQTIPMEQIEAASIEGANSWQCFWKVKLPFLYPTLTIVLVLFLKSGLLVFDNIMAMTGGGPAGSTISLAYVIYLHGFTETKFSYSIAEAIFVGLIICVISALQISYSNRKKVVL